ncbi:MAG: hypothetical protein UX13_C0016G0003 [Candidatus Woesebacteria bacterium GW2011_GWB1_45_5]|uniref:M23ase beta-sheet core domain-containing protein n=1 Tax=Candidatus Woesebacteria bacterium GW2011_GWB1_45_5 TaxID=1618581 RepID=A0A0G1MPH8_9BACT|nr:MAG: hypothetical protein UX13_C0016G0003 [Candidatus Woesebacteria bacterium GW2011_GWB1_45_5]
MAGEILLFQNVIASRNIMMGIDPDIAWAAFGASIDDFRVSLSDTQIEGTATVNLYQMGQGYIQLLQNQSAFFDNIGSLAQTEAKSFLMGQARLWLDGQIAGMSPEIAGVYDSAAVQNALKLAGFGQPVAFGETAFGSVILKIPGAPAFLEGLGGSLGIDLVGGAGTAAATAATEAAVTVGSGAATSAATAITAEITGAAAAPVTGGLSLIISIIVAIVGPKVIKFIKDNAQKYSKFIVGLVVGTFGFLLAGGSILGGILGFGIGYGGAAALTGGLPAVGAAASSFFSGASTAAGIIWTTFLAGAGKPILITLFVFPVVVAFILFIINSGAYIVPPAPRGEGSGAIESPYIDVVKTAIPPGPFENEDLPLTVEYKIEVKAKKGPLQNVSIKYSCSVIKEASSTICPEPDPGVPATVEGGISPATPFSFTYKQTYNELNYQDSFVTDVITVTADAVEQSGARAADSATIKIGEPPEDCPSIWPTNGGSITQGAYTSDSHKSIEAIDVGTGPTTVLATHSGVIVSAQNDYCYGNNIKIQSNCGGRDFISRYAHLEGMSIGTGQAVTMGQTIGLSGNSTGGAGTKCSTGYHLHYEFKYWPSGNPKWPDNPPFMMNPYIPEDVRRGCVTREACGVSW